MTRTFVTSAQEDAAIAWKAKAKGVSEDTLIRLAMTEPLTEVVREWLDADGAAIYEALQKAGLSQRAAVKVALGL